MNDLIKARLASELSSLNDCEKFTSLIIDEMAIQPKCLYDKGSDAIFGFTFQDTERKILANRLLCFVIHGLSTNFTIPCSYFFTKNLSGKKLYHLTTKVIEDVENCGFFVIRVVTDNHKTNVLLFKKLSKGEMKPIVKHPNDESRFLFLSFDPNHLIKNIRSQFLEKEMSGSDGYITGSYVKKLYEIQRDQVIKPVRFLTRKHVFPNNLEKMNVLRAVQIFSVQVIAALQFFRECPSAHSQGHFFSESGDTIKYMMNIKKWFDIHDVGNRTLGVHSKNPNKEHFLSFTDERLGWLETEFPSYLEEIKR
ncbi:hypothetical protein JTE90_015695 [Oedothorax gibbosus]|uniref:Transposase n=1 Tax=Oedothorax gibbosus TaxID=931172 RepID=A0AAV6TRQ7_9ARAC|nr:hypothetical protein JTE90_015695 [Oedothorax gibbosus]